MRILHCLDSIDPAFGGPVEAVRQFARFRQPGTKVEVATLDDDVSQWRATWPVDVHALGKGYSTYRYNPAFVSWLRSRHKEYDAVVVHGMFRYNLVGTWQALHRTSCPYYVIPHGMLNPWFKARYPLKHLEKALFWHWRIKHAMQAAAGVIYLTQEEERLANQTFDVTGFRAVFHPLGIEDPAIAGPPQSGRLLDPKLRGKRLIVFFGRICEMKGCDILIRAFAIAKLPENVALVFAGPDNEHIQARLQQLSVACGVADRTFWVGPVYGSAKFELLRRTELFALPSHCETFPVAVLEALACNIPVLVSDKVNLWDTIQNSEAGLICADNDDSVAGQLRSWFGSESSVRAEMRNRARACFENHFRIEHAVRLHEQIVSSHEIDASSGPLKPLEQQRHHEPAHG